MLYKGRLLLHCGPVPHALLTPVPSHVFSGPSLAAAAQSYTAARITFSDKGSYSQAQLEQASGLHAGSTFTQEQLGQAAQRLVDTGLFVEVGAALEGPVKAVSVNFTATPIPVTQMLHVGFRNFVWLTHDEIEAAITARFPLFIDYLPENSPQQDVIKAALTDALAAKSISAKVAYESFEPTLAHPAQEIVFTVQQPSVRVGDIHLSGVSAALAPYVQKSVNATARKPYIEPPANETSYDSILAPLLDAGYVAATLDHTSAVPVPEVNGNVNVVLSARLNPGAVYRVSALTFGGSPLFTTEAFAASARLHAGDLASRKLLIETLTPLDAAYRAKGYMDVVVDAHPKLDDEAHTVAYNVTVTPGEQYHVHQVTANNLPPAPRADFDRGFLLTTGTVYNPTYIDSFLKKNTALLTLAPYAASYKTYADPATHTVDVVIDFYLKPVKP